MLQHSQHIEMMSIMHLINQSTSKLFNEAGSDLICFGFDFCDLRFKQFKQDEP